MHIVPNLESNLLTCWLRSLQTGLPIPAIWLEAHFLPKHVRPNIFSFSYWYTDWPLFAQQTLSSINQSYLRFKLACTYGELRFSISSDLSFLSLLFTYVVWQRKEIECLKERRSFLWFWCNLHIFFFQAQIYTDPLAKQLSIYLHSNGCVCFSFGLRYMLYFSWILIAGYLVLNYLLFFPLGAFWWCSKGTCFTI